MAIPSPAQRDWRKKRFFEILERVVRLAATKNPTGINNPILAFSENENLGFISKNATERSMLNNERSSIVWFYISNLGLRNSDWKVKLVVENGNYLCAFNGDSVVAY